MLGGWLAGPRLGSVNNRENEETYRLLKPAPTSPLNTSGLQVANLLVPCLSRCRVLEIVKAYVKSRRIRATSDVPRKCHLCEMTARCEALVRGAALARDARGREGVRVPVG